MTRLHADPVEVRTHDTEPEQFLWRGRLYVVREVLARWTEAGRWWSTGAVRALSTGESGAPGASESSSESSSGGSSPASSLAPSLGVDDRERDWWRVEAGQGRFAATGVYDLCRDGASGTWSLARVLD